MDLPSPLKDELDYANRILKEFLAESDRSAAVLLGAEIDAQLERILDKFLLPPLKKSSPLLQSDGPLGSFASRIEMIYRIGLVPEEWHHDLHLIRKIRNKFAHGPLGLSFSQSPISDLAENLQIGRQMLKKTYSSQTPPDVRKALNSPKNIYHFTCSYLVPQMVLLRYNTPSMTPLWKHFMQFPPAGDTASKQEEPNKSGEGTA